MKIEDFCFKDKCPVCSKNVETYATIPTYWKCAERHYTCHHDPADYTEITINHELFILKLFYKYFTGKAAKFELTIYREIYKAHVRLYEGYELFRIINTAKDFNHLVSKIQTRLLL